MKGRAYVGQRDRRVEVVRFTATKNDLNEDVKTEVSVGFFWSSMQDVSGSEEEEGKVIYIVNRVYIIPYLSEINISGEEMEVKDGGKNFQIYHVQEIGRKNQLLLKCTNTKRE